jgi:hypothetical protein
MWSSRWRLITVEEAEELASDSGPSPDNVFRRAVLALDQHPPIQ